MSNYYNKYYTISFILLAFSFFSFTFSKKVKEYLIIFIFSIVSTLYAFEGYLSLFANVSNIKVKKILYEKETGKKFDTRTRLKVFKDLYKTNKKVSIKISPSQYLPNHYEMFPLSSVSNSKTIYGNENGYYFIYDSDRYGFNNPDKEWDNEEIEYILIGDSFTHGANVNRPNDIASILRILSKKSVLNLGYSGNGPLIEYATLKEYFKVKAKNVLWIYYEGNDLKDLYEERKNKILMKYVNDNNFSQNLILRQNEINNLVNNIIYRSVKNERLNFFKLYQTRSKLFNKKNDPNKQLKIPKEFEKILELAKKFILENNARIYFVYLPDYYRYKADYDNTNYNLIKKIITDLDIPFIDIHKEVFEKHKDPLELFPFKMFGHYNEIGYQKIAESIYRLSKN